MKSIKIKTRTLQLFLFIVISLWMPSLLYSQSQDFSKSPLKSDNKTTNIIFPRPFAIAIDDLGWNIGNNDGWDDHDGPYRIGIDRKMNINDYRALVEVAKQIPVRLQALFVLGEMDRENVLKKYPTTNPLGKNWDNTNNISDEQIDIMSYVLENAAYLEFGLHGVLHEYWEKPGDRTRAEWYNIDDDKPWPTDIMLDHIECFKEIMGQYGLSLKNGHSFPESFVPCAYAYHWNPDGEISTSSLLNNQGVKYINTLFQQVSELDPPTEPNGGALDHGTIAVNRINYGNDWFALSSTPTVPIEMQESDIIESHWSNWLAQDEFLQKETNKKWVDYYNMVMQQESRFVARNTAQFYSQWLYKKYTVVTEDKTGKVIIENSQMPQEIYDNDLLGNMILKIPLAEGKHISKATIDGNNIAGYYEDNSYGIIVLPLLSNKSHTLNYSIDDKKIAKHVWYDGTYNVLSFSSNNKNTKVSIRLYGKQKIRIVGINAPKNISINNPNIVLLNKEYNTDDKTLTLTLSAHDIQGENGEIKIW